MGNVNARLKIKNKQFEILVDLDKALMFRKTGQGSIENVLAFNKIFSDIKKGMHASATDLQESFNTADIEKVAAEIIKKGEIEISAEYRKKEHDAKVRQVIDFIARNYVDPKNSMPHSADRIETAMHDAHINVTDKPIAEQVPEVIKQLQKILALKTETKKIQIKIPAAFTGSVYGMLQGFKEKEEWLDDGSLLVVVSFPAGMQSEFYDKLNNITHGAAVTQEIKEK